MHESCEFGAQKTSGGFARFPVCAKDCGTMHDQGRRLLILWMEEILHQLVNGLCHACLSQCNPIIYSVS